MLRKVSSAPPLWFEWRRKRHLWWRTPARPAKVATTLNVVPNGVKKGWKHGALKIASILIIISDSRRRPQKARNFGRIRKSRSSSTNRKRTFGDKDQLDPLDMSRCEREKKGFLISSKLQLQSEKPAGGMKYFFRPWTKGVFLGRRQMSFFFPYFLQSEEEHSMVADFRYHTHTQRNRKMRMKERERENAFASQEKLSRWAFFFPPWGKSLLSLSSSRFLFFLFFFPSRRNWIFSRKRLFFILHHNFTLRRDKKRQHTPPPS